MAPPLEVEVHRVREGALDPPVDPQVHLEARQGPLGFQEPSEVERVRRGLRARRRLAAWLVWRRPNRRPVDD